MRIPARRVRNAACLAAMMGTVSACHHLDCGTHRDNFTTADRNGKSLAYVNFDRGEAQDPYTVNLTRDRERHGYAIRAPLQGNDDVIKTDFTLSNTREYKWFSGLQLSYEF